MRKMSPHESPSHQLHQTNVMKKTDSLTNELKMRGLVKLGLQTCSLARARCSYELRYQHSLGVAVTKVTDNRCLRTWKVQPCGRCWTVGRR